MTFGPGTRPSRIGGSQDKSSETYGYDKYGGNCHMVPNHGLIILSLLYGDDDFSKTMMIINTSGWDTDCNSGNIGCLMGIKLGLKGLDAGATNGKDWRGPVADRLYIPNADPTWGLSDCLRETEEIVNTGNRLAGTGLWQPSCESRLPGAPANPWNWAPTTSP